jgi:hypothetical protein
LFVAWGSARWAWADPAAPDPVQPPLEVEVHAEKAPPSVSSLSRGEVREIPGAFGDPFRAIDTLPGVTPIVSGLPYFYVRGAPPGNVGYFLDGVRVPYLFHIAIGPSVVNPAMVDKVDLYSGGYPAEYGRYAGAVVAASTTGPRDDWHGEGNVRVFDAGGMVEGGFDAGRGTVLLGGRYSYTAAIFSLLSPGTQLDYRDFQARVTYDLTPRDRVGVFAFGSYDLLAGSQNGVSTVVFGSEFYRVDARYDRKLEDDGRLRLGVTGGFEQTHVVAERNARDTLFGTRVEVVQPLRPNVTVRTGADLEVDGYTADTLRFSDPDNPYTQEYNALFPARTDVAWSARGDVVWKVVPHVEVTPGVRLDLFRSGDASATSVDGRLALNVEALPHVRLLHAIGLAHQPPSFILPLPGLAVGSLQNGLQSAVQSSAGVEVELPKVATATVTLFDDVFLNMSDMLAAQPTAQLTVSELLKPSEPRSLGSAYGIEVYIRRRLTQKLGGFLSYTLSRSIRSAGRYTFPAAFDRTHVLNTALAYDLGRGWRAGGRFTFYTGAPTVSSLSAPSSNPPRYPNFYRIDLRVEKRWSLGGSRWISAVAEGLNVTLQSEVVGGQQVGPITIPSVGIEGGF